jgi:hypothetical protein
MKKFNLSKELLLNGVLIGALSIGLVSCGGGGGGGSVSSTPTSPGSSSSSTPPGSSSSSTPTPPGSSSPSTPLSYSLATYLYAGTDHFNEPIITVYIDGQPVQLLADTGHSGLVVNSSAVNIPSVDIYSSYTFLDDFHGYNHTLSGTMASATVCLNPSITNTCVLMPIGVLESGNLFSTSSEAQGVFGLASGINSLDAGSNIISNYSMTGYSYPYYLEMQYGINSYNISFYSLTNGYYSNVSSTTPIGQISFGAYNGNSNTLIPYTMDSFGDPSTTVVFSSSTTSFTSDAVFDSGNSYNALSTSVFQTEIPNFFQNTSYENACANYDGFQAGIVNGGFVISYSLQNNSGSFQTESFTTEPSSSFCQANNPFTLMEGVTVDNGPEPFGDIFGLPAMLGHTFTWVLANNGSNQGFVQYIGINP